ncbi:ABC transporter permease [Cellulomonas palmilytica]|uniref:ABC transporter permease n=1 Tax=Cellulomonas palmilytica TaxID=2608402 RepID=UPI001F44FEFB|nr:ABC transporter permease subunit [Cellulomonas palmilytica]UJP39745.1 ABC transporter permease subunit [Cellulomonas palmilytica]
MSDTGGRTDEGPLARRARTAAAVACWLVVWQVAALALGQPILLVGPWDVVVRLVELVPTGELWATVGRTLTNVALGFTLALVAAVALAAAAAAWRWADALLAPLVSTIRATPVVAFIILVLLWTDSARLALVVAFLMALPVLYVNVLEGVRQRDERLLEMTRVFAVPWPRRLAAVDAPGVLPYLVAGCRTGIGLAWKSGIAAEVIGLPAGSIGEQMYQAKLFLATADLLAWTVVVVVLAALTERVVLALLERARRALAAGDRVVAGGSGR